MALDWGCLGEEHANDRTQLRNWLEPIKLLNFYIKRMSLWAGVVAQ